MEIISLSNGIFGSKTYIIIDGSECAVIDCGNKDSEVISILKEKNLMLKYIILTHGHVDHVYYTNPLKEATGATLCLHGDEVELYSDLNNNGYNMFGFDRKLKLPMPDIKLNHGDKLQLNGTTLEIIHTPGHSPGSICVLCNEVLFSGDTLFCEGVGRTDLFGGSFAKILCSIRDRLFILDKNTIVYPGHGPSTTIGHEMERNPYV